jgi:hypothetical protein
MRTQPCQDDRFNSRVCHKIYKPVNFKGKSKLWGELDICNLYFDLLGIRV